MNTELIKEARVINDDMSILAYKILRVFNRLIEAVQEAEALAQRYRTALEWYADATRYDCGSECCNDNGERARAALEGDV